VRDGIQSCGRRTLLADESRSTTLLALDQLDASSASIGGKTALARVKKQAAAEGNLCMVWATGCST